MAEHEGTKKDCGCRAENGNCMVIGGFCTSVPKEYCSMAIEIQQYRSVGTVEEFQNAMNKQRVKKPIRSDMCTCPSCGTYNESVKKRRNTVNQDIVYCWHCGQAMGINRRDE